MRANIYGMVILLSLLAVLLGLACNFSGSEVAAPQIEVGPGTILDASENLDNEPALFLTTMPPRDDNKIILISVERTNDGNLAKVEMLIPDHLIGFVVFANDNKVDTVKEDKNLVIDLIDKVSDGEVAFTFQSDGKTLATCTIMMDSILTPEGDCIW